MNTTMQLSLKEGKVVEVKEVEVDVLQLKRKVEILRQEAQHFTAQAALKVSEADALEASLAAPEVKAVVDAKEAEVAAAAEPVVAEEVVK